MQTLLPIARPMASFLF